MTLDLPGEIVSVDGKPVNKELMSIDNDNLLDIALYAEKQIEAINKIKNIVLKLTTASDWTDQGGKPYLTASGCHKVAGVFGISWRFIGEPKKIKEEDGHFRYETMLAVIMGRRSIEVIGSRSSKDPFFTIRYRDGQKTELPSSEIDGGDILKASITNAQAIGITALLGIRNLTWEDLEEAGIKRANVSSVDYKKPEMSQEAQDQRAKIWDMLLEMGQGKPENARKLLARATEFTGKDGQVVAGKTDLSKLTEKQIPITYGKVKKAYNEWKAKQSKPKETPPENPPEDDTEKAVQDFLNKEAGFGGQQTIA